MLLFLSSWMSPISATILPVLLAQDTVPPAPEFSPGQSVLSIVLYFVGAFFCMKIYDKVGVENSWFAFIPFLNIYANLKAGDEESPVLWTILAIVPCVNLVTLVKLIIAWINICKKIGKSPWLLLLCIFPIVQTIILGYFAFG